MRFHTAVLLVLASLVLSGCKIHLVGDSTAWLVQAYAVEQGYVITGSPEPGCGFTTINGNRVTPGGTGGYPMCTIDWANADLPDDPDDVIFSFVSIHDAMCSTVDGCEAIDAGPYQAAHTHLLATGYPVVWVETPPLGSQALRDRIDELNAAVAAELDCALVPSGVRVAPTWDGIHYVQEGGLMVAVRLAALAENPPIC